jgi:hypothetical protein
MLQKRNILGNTGHFFREPYTLKFFCKVKCTNILLNCFIIRAVSNKRKYVVLSDVALDCFQIFLHIFKSLKKYVRYHCCEILGIPYGQKGVKAHI